MQKSNETGRSMLEMLGVLAIIGILSVGGMTGYNLAMNRHNAEQIFNMASALSASTTGGARSAQTETLKGAELKLNEKGFVCITWQQNASDDVKEIFEKRVAVYENQNGCINFKKRKTLKDITKQ